MPLLIGPTRPDPPPVLYQPGVDVGRARATYVDPWGGLWPLDEPSRGWFTLDEVTGLGTAPVDITADPMPRGGTQVRHQYPSPRVINWPLHIGAADAMTFARLWWQLAKVITATKRVGPGWLRIYRPDGTSREIAVYYQAGFDSSPGRNHTNDDVVISWYCPDPYWRDTTVTTVVREYTVGTPYLAPYPTVSSSRVLGATTVTTLGQVETWPEIRIHGPATLFTGHNHTAEQEFILNPDWDGGGPLLAGQTVTVTADPPMILGPAGEIWTDALDWTTADLWPLLDGPNELMLDVSGANVGSRVELLYRNRYETP